MTYTPRHKGAIDEMDDMVMDRMYAKVAKDAEINKTYRALKTCLYALPNETLKQNALTYLSELYCLMNAREHTGGE